MPHTLPWACPISPRSRYPLPLSGGRSSRRRGRAGVGIYGVGRYFQRRAPRVGIMLGYPRMGEADIREGVRRLAEIL